MKRSLIGMAVVVAGLHVIGFGGLLMLSAPNSLTLGAGGAAIWRFGRIEQRWAPA